MYQYGINEKGFQLVGELCFFIYSLIIKYVFGFYCEGVWKLV